MAQLRNFQFLRNSEISSFATYAAARTEAERAFAGITTLLDGEIALYSYKLDSDATKVHTLLGIKRTNGIEIVANYDELTNYVDTQIQALDSTVTSTSNGVTVTVTQVDGKIDSVSVVAPSLPDAIAALDANPFSLTEVTGTELKGYQIYEEDGIIKKGTNAETLLTFASEPSATNKVVTLKEIQDLDTPPGGVSSAEGNNVKVTVTQVDGKVDTVTVVDNSVNATDVNNAITTAIAGLESNVKDTNVAGDITVKVSQANGELTSVEISDTLKAVAHTGAAVDVSIADTAELFTATNVEAALAEVMGKANDLQAAQLSAGKGIDIVTSTVDGVTTNSINADLKLSIANETTGEGESAVTTTYLYIKDTEGNLIDKVNANAFVKDGFLKSVTKDSTTNELIFTWNTDAEGAGENDQVTRIAISDLCDVYTADETYLHLNGYKFEHKTVTGLDSENAHGSITRNDTGVTGNNLTNAGESINLAIPIIKVDAAGHVTRVDETTTTITLPASIGTAIQGGDGVDTTYIQTTVARNATNTNQLDVKATAVIGDYAEGEAQVDGLATTTATKTYVDGKINALQDYNTETTVSAATDGGIIVTPNITGADTVNEQRTYAISLDTVARVDNPTADGTAGTPSESSFADDVKTFTYVKAVNTDANGRVTGIVTETVTENFDAGTY